MKEYWEILRELREDRDLKQSTVAHVLGTTQQVYSRYENGVLDVPSQVLIALAKFHGVSVDYLLGLE
jgi:transcriptional regulator with XRE-family HTH domain